MTKVWKWLLIGAVALVAGCTADGRVRMVDGMYRKVYPDNKLGGWYYVNSHGEKVHLDELPPEPELGSSQK